MANQGPKLGPPAPATRVGETVGLTRTTRDGRRLHYELKVLQQPERARACGSGPKCELRRPHNSRIDVDVLLCALRDLE